MTREPPKNTKTQVALTLAQGVSVTTRARADEVPKPTAYGWASDPKVRGAVESYSKTVSLSVIEYHLWRSSQTSLESVARAYPQSNLGTLAKDAVDARKRAASSGAYTP
jgi:hypothetical protein